MANLAPVSAYPFSGCLMLSVPNVVKLAITDEARKCQRAWKLAHPEKQATEFEVPSKFHVSLMTYFAKTKEAAARINAAAHKVMEGYSKFTIGPHTTKGLTLFEHDARQATAIPKDFVACQVMVKDSGQNAEHQILMQLNERLTQVVKDNGGVLVRPDFIPHVTVGKITPPGNNKFPLPTVGGWAFPVSPVNLFQLVLSRKGAAPVPPPAHAPAPAPARTGTKRLLEGNAEKAAPPIKRARDESELSNLIAVLGILQSQGAPKADIDSVKEQIQKLVA